LVPELGLLAGHSVQSPGPFLAPRLDFSSAVKRGAHLLTIRSALNVAQSLSCQGKKVPRLWTSYQDVAAYARNRSVALGIVIVVRRVKGGWVLPYYSAMSNGVFESSGADEGFKQDAVMSYVEDENFGCGDGTSGLSSNCGETLMEGYQLFNRD
jgi:hypothetical protein